MTLRFQAVLLAGGLICAAAHGVHAAGWPGPAFPDYRSPTQVRKACESGLRGARLRLAALEKQAPDAGWLAAYDDFNGWVEDVYGPVAFISHVHPSRDVREAAEACEVRWQAFFSAMGLNRRLYSAARQVLPADDIDRHALQSIIENAEDAGVLMPTERQREARRLSDQISALSQAFDKRIVENKTRLAFRPDELAGVPEGVLRAAPRDSRGRLMLGLDYPTYFPVLERAENARTRERLWRAKTNEGGVANMRLLRQITSLRLRYARLFGQKSYADFVLRRRMARSVERANQFLMEVQGAVTRSEQRELAELAEAKARHLGLPIQQVRLERWDQAFYAERLRQKKLAVDDEAFRPHFPPQESLRFVMRVAERLFGIRYTRVPARLWHADVQAYAVSDAATGKPLASLVVDIYPREGKYGHAAVWAYRSGSTRNDRLPQAALVANFDRKGLTLQELDTLLHEFGHSLHSNLSSTRYTLQAGTTTQLDFVEAPSQMLEDWVFDPRVIKLFQEVCAACPPVPDALLAKARAARDLDKGSNTARQHLYATYDLALNGPTAPEPAALWARMEGATPLGHVRGTLFPSGFGHLVSDYAAGYYAYLWSLVLAMDLRTAFAADRLDPAVGQRYREKVLSQGGQRPPEQLLRDFLGREPSSAAFFDDLAR